MTVHMRRFGKSRRWSRDRMRHRVSGRGKGKWQSRKTLIAYKAKARRIRKTADESRRRNRVA